MSPLRTCLAASIALLAFSGCGGDFGNPLSDEQTEPLLVLDLDTASADRAPEGVEPTARRLIFRRLPAGSFTASTGDALVEDGRTGTASAAASIPSGVWICVHELSQAQWNRLAPTMRDPWLQVVPASAGGSKALGGDLPAWGLDATSVIAACAAWSAGSPAVLRLPTAQEWEAAASNPEGSGDWGWGDDESQAGLYARLRSNSGGEGPRAVSGHTTLGGLQDMHGNVWEWVTDGADPPHLRGGSWNDSVRSAMIENRMACPADLGYALAGVRLVLVVP